MQVTSLQPIWDIFDAAWGDQGSTPDAAGHAAALAQQLAIEDGDPYDPIDDSVMADATDHGDAASVATTLHDESCPDEVPDSLPMDDPCSAPIEISDSLPGVVHWPDSQPIEYPGMEDPSPEVPDSQPVDDSQAFDDMTPQIENPQPAHVDESPHVATDVDKNMAGDDSQAGLTSHPDEPSKELEDYPVRTCLSKIKIMLYSPFDCIQDKNH